MPADPPLTTRPVPPFPGLLRTLGPGVVWLAMAQGSGELIWWPYIVAKYGMGFLFLLVPACLLQAPLNYHIGVYTLLTGESIFRGFLRLHRLFAILLWLLMTIQFLWFGAFASAGGQSLAALTSFPPGWSPRAQTLFWAYASMAILFTGLVLSRRVYRLIERLMLAVTVITVVGLLVACLHPDVRASFAEFALGLVRPSWPAGVVWDPRDGDKLLTAITFAGLGGFWALFYSYWLREKGAGMAAHLAHDMDPVTGRSQALPGSGFTFAAEPTELGRMARWKRYLVADSLVGIVGNILTTLMTCLLAHALLRPRGLVPGDGDLAVVQAEFFARSWGVWGRLAFLLVAAAFLADSWIVTLDAVSRVHADFLHAAFPRLRAIASRKLYLGFVLGFTAITAVTLWFDQPGPLLTLSAVIGFAGTVVFTLAFFGVSFRILPRLVPRAAAPGRWAGIGLAVTAAAYMVLATLYCLHRLGALS